MIIFNTYHLQVIHEDADIYSFRAGSKNTSKGIYYLLGEKKKRKLGLECARKSQRSVKALL